MDLEVQPFLLLEILLTLPRLSLGATNLSSYCLLDRIDTIATSFMMLINAATRGKVQKSHIPTRIVEHQLWRNEEDNCTFLIVGVIFQSAAEELCMTTTELIKVIGLECIRVDIAFFVLVATKT